MISLVIVIIAAILLAALVLWVKVCSDGIKEAQRLTNVQYLKICPHGRLHRIIKAKYKAKEYTMGRHPFWYDFEVDGKTHTFSSVELDEAGILNG